MVEDWLLEAPAVIRQQHHKISNKLYDPQICKMGLRNLSSLNLRSNLGHIIAQLLFH